jgi:hypothetical protein
MLQNYKKDIKKLETEILSLNQIIFESIKRLMIIEIDNSQKIKN